MGQDVVAVLALFLGGPAAWGRSLVLSGLLLAVVNCLRFLVSRPAVALAADGAAPTVRHEGWRKALRGPHAALALPPLLVLAGASSGTFLTVAWYVPCSAPLYAVGVVAVRRLRAEHGRRGEDIVAGPVLAVLLATATLVQVGVIMALRLGVSPDPGAGFARTFDLDALAEVGFSILVPLGVAFALLWFERRRVERWAAKRPFTRFTPTWRYLTGIGAVFVLIIAPKFDPLGDDGLTFLKVATAEYAKVLCVWVLAVVLARYAIGFQVAPPPLPRSPQELWESRTRLPRWFRRNKHLGYTFLILGVVGAAVIWKGDIGPIIPLLAAAGTVVLHLLRGQVGSGVGRWDTLKAGRTLVASLLVVVAVALVVFRVVDHVQTRQEAWAEPWTFNWSVACQAPPAGVVVPEAPNGYEVCLDSLDNDAAAKRSQIAQSMSAVADGGVWGRGLADTVLGPLPAGDTDFVLAVIWNKLGGLAVLLLALLLALLAAALTRAHRHLDRFAEDRAEVPGGQRAGRAARLFAVGVAGVLLGQFGFVLAATTNQVPHSGITAPFLSRGGHSTLALLVAVMAAVWLLYRADRPLSPRPPTAPRTATVRTPELPGLPLAKLRRVVPLAVVVVFALVGGLATVVTARPYGHHAQDRPTCTAESARIDPERCSTDRVANRRTSVELHVDGVPAYFRDRAEQQWAPIDPTPLALSDFAGLIRLHGRGGVLNNALDPLIERSSGTSLGERLLPTPGGPERGVIDLTLRPALQRSLTGALRADAAEAEPLAGGIVVLDARTGQVLAASSAPSPFDWPAKAEPDLDRAGATAFVDRNEDYGPVEDGRLAASETGCETTEWDNRCRRWSLQRQSAGYAEEERAEERRYAPGAPDSALPSIDENRALGRRYGLGSTFKVVVAAAFLAQPGNTAQTTIPSPATYRPRNGEPIENYTKARCEGTGADGRITLQQALTVSCNTAFVQLVDRELGWAAVRDMAVRMGFADLSAGGADTAWLAGLDTGKASFVPNEVDVPGSDSLGNNVLGGGRVEGTPLQLATMMTAVANGGVVVQPSLVSATAGPFGRDRTEHRGVERRVLTAEQARELSQALSGVTQDDSGTAHQLRVDRERSLRVKTGTHEIRRQGESPGSAGFATQNAWVVGALDTAAGPVTFAVTVETGTEEAGARRVRLLAQQVIDKVVEVRG
ncbi:penicillin-binding transpeptidase domain-containing protein [Saccharothrix sp. HUAS TT1]|uniref:penicillin-binding transpeptidase domain-containing protein n=1 Tax=unclassified Saccharothrix TaxID=2593673 RepID=UPI00345B599D